MARNGSGTFNRSNGTNSGSTTWALDAAAGTKILSTRHDLHDQDIAAALTASIANDGQTPILANLPMSTYAHTNVGAATSRTMYARASQIQDNSLVWGGTSGGSANTQTITLTPAVTAYTTGMKVAGLAGFTNSGAVTLNINGVGATTIKDIWGADLAASSIVAASIFIVIYNGTNWILLSPCTTNPTQNIYWGGTSGGAANVQTISLSAAITAYTTGMMVMFIAGFANSAACTLNVNGIAAKTIKKGTSTTDVATGDILVGDVLLLVYDGTYFRPVNGTDFAFKMDGSGNGVIVPSTVLAPATFSLLANTTDAADNGLQTYGHSGSTRGAQLLLAGNEHANTGQTTLQSGNVASSFVSLLTPGAYPVKFGTNATYRWTVDGTSGDLVPVADNTYNIGSAALTIKSIFAKLQTWTPTVSANGAMTVSGLTVNQADYWQCGPYWEFEVSVSFTLGGTQNTQVKISAPVAGTAHNGSCSFTCCADQNSTVVAAPRWRYTGSEILVFQGANPNWTLGAGASIHIQGRYKI